MSMGAALALSGQSRSKLEKLLAPGLRLVYEGCRHARSEGSEEVVGGS